MKMKILYIAIIAFSAYRGISHQSIKVALGSLTVFTLLWLLIYIPLFLYRKFKTHAKDSFEKELARINSEYGTKFLTSTPWLGTLSTGYLFFDLTNKKILIYRNPKNFRVEEFSFIRNWELCWKNSSNMTGAHQYSDIHFQFATSDINVPTIRIGVATRMGIHLIQDGEDWNNRLKIIFS